MCDFRRNMRTVNVKYPRKGVKFASPGNTGLYQCEPRGTGWMRCRGWSGTPFPFPNVPATGNLVGFYLYPCWPKKPQMQEEMVNNLSLEREDQCWLVMYKGQCVYGDEPVYFSDEAEPRSIRGVRAEYVKFIKRISRKELLRMCNRSCDHERQNACFCS